ncbi:MAG: cytochrome c3 family protein [Planctomycetota bacterium]
MTRPKTLRARALLSAIALVALVACGTLMAPAHHWDEDRGPVVPHATFPADCRLCHTGEGWSEIREDFTFDHLAETGYALDGAHATATCLRCHNDRGPVEVFAERGCGGCHVDPHRTRLGPDCSSCHNADTWLPREQIEMHARTRMPLVGAHAVAQCFQCHPGAEVGNFEGLDPTCTNCHGQDLARATRPDHVQQGWTVDCQRCHVPLGWQPARFDHPSSLPLVGGHAGLDCAACHTDPTNFAGLDPSCFSCHSGDYAATTNPNHAQLAFDQDCRLCHSVFGWGGGNFQHPSSFPLTGGHAGRNCTDCHGNGVFVGTSPDCVSCHREDYDRTTNPNHALQGFSTTCTQCHTTARWGGATFDHRFPITSGAHAGIDCTECHTPQAPAPRFSCIECHEHDQASMDRKHQGERGYVWASPDCYRCHPNGRG